jgi:hypothetical protein
MVCAFVLFCWPLSIWLFLWCLQIFPTSIIVLSVLLQFTTSDCPVDIFTLFVWLLVKRSSILWMVITRQWLARGYQRKYKCRWQCTTRIHWMVKAPRISSNTGGELRCSGRVSSPTPHVTPVVLKCVDTLKYSFYLFRTS